MACEGLLGAGHHGKCFPYTSAPFLEEPCEATLTPAYKGGKDGWRGQRLPQATCWDGVKQGLEPVLFTP